MIRNMSWAVPLLIATPLAAELGIMSAPDAYAAVKAGDMILVDIRSPGEWDQTGVAEGALALTMHSPDFAKKITSLLSSQRVKTIGLICATGGRTDYVVSFLARNGFSDVVNVSEGMMGNARGAGWIARGLPLVTSQVGQARYQRFLTEQ